VASLRLTGDPPARPIGVHDEVEGEVLDEELCVMLHGSAIEGVEHGVAGAVGGSAAAVRLAALAEVQALASEGALVDFALLGAREGHACGAGGGRAGEVGLGPRR